MALTSSRYSALITDSRKSWDPSYRGHRRRGSRPVTRVLGLEVHYAGSPASVDTVNADPIDRLLAYKRYHKGTKRWSDIWYQVAASVDGRIFAARDASVTSQRSTKQWLTFLCIAGQERLNEKQLFQFGVSIEKAWLACSPNRNQKWLRCHRDRSATACPGDQIFEVVARLKTGWRPGDELAKYFADLEAAKRIEAEALRPKPTRGELKIETPKLSFEAEQRQAESRGFWNGVRGDEPVTRAEAAVMVLRASKWTS